MNELTVIQTTQGLLRYLEQDLQQSQRRDQRDHAHQLETATASVTPTHRGDCVAGADLLRQHGVCIGYDHRQRGTLSSEKFALLAAAVFLSQNVRTPYKTGTGLLEQLSLDDAMSAMPCAGACDALPEVCPNPACTVVC